MSSLPISTIRSTGYPSSDALQAPGAPGLSVPTNPAPLTPRPAREPEPEARLDPSQKELDEAVSRLNQAIAESPVSLRFEIDRELSRPVVKVIDPTTETVIRQYPTEEALKLSKSLRDLAGLLLNTEA